ncbi:MAG: DUF1064 domain-containing protein [Lachnospiraceae bacterium]|nr:DUF1064 domain-containing protein [Lachnospiraceae bacterium]
MAWRRYGNKYGNHKVTFEGMTFDSKKELYRWLDLKTLEKAGKIYELQRQVKFVLVPAQYEPDTVGPRGGKIKGKLIEKELAYYADFYYFDNETGKYVVEDAKGVRTPEYVIKRKLMLYLKGYRIKEV